MVVDTMVFAYALVGVSAHREAAVAVLGRADRVVVPDSCYTELANVVWKWVRSKGVPEETGHAVLADAEALITRSFPTTHLWADALALAVGADHPVYDTLFVAAARREQTRVVTFDKRLQSAFPEWTIPPAAVLPE